MRPASRLASMAPLELTSLIVALVLWIALLTTLAPDR